MTAVPHSADQDAKDRDPQQREQAIDAELIYLAFGVEYATMAWHSARTAQRSNPNLKKTLVTNLRFDADCSASPFEKTIEVESHDLDNRHYKTRICNFVESTLFCYVDADTTINRDLSPIFRALDWFDLAAKPEGTLTNKDYEIAPQLAAYEGLPAWNGGVFFARNKRAVTQLFERWHQWYVRDGKQKDQPTLHAAITQSTDVRVLPLHPFWNHMFKEELRIPHKNKTPAITHYRSPTEYPQVAKGLEQELELLSASLKGRDAERDTEVSSYRRKLKTIRKTRSGIIGKLGIGKLAATIALLAQGASLREIRGKRKPGQSHDRKKL
ncbi:MULTISPECIES: putative nucleotide-diphospho-sugar transferase [Halorhodospira]|uniref:putative nucleotide-diphospho-sugar transferase n=1 Tax=Halorhodospira TaxID=85108 RepID=UPI001EE98AA4|nr:MULTISPECIES: putative nucleotide-diphospho-sugar transferase [Halorhodospira]MCG5528873.1 glycosyltransferase family 77 protein [Halorhodospira halophila]MCG5544259.1 glycosyltransferase family 77 protein [Halorhodospira sp. 9628]